MSEAGAPGERVELGDLRDLIDGQMRCFEAVGEHGIVVCRAAGKLYALDDRCSHADTPLSEGRVRGFSVTCPLHGASFDVRDGSHSGPPAWEGVTSHPVEESDDTAVVVLQSAADAVAPEAGRPPRMR
jgi:3-phenylpropionate/trans-cinnamate dioxygenase ferredoxin subunit